MKKLLIALVLMLLASTAQARITWQTNDDPMTGVKMATVFLWADDGVFAVRIDSPDNEFVIFKPLTAVPAAKGTMQIRFDSEVMRQYEAEDASQRDFWQLSTSGLGKTISKGMCDSGIMLVRIKTDNFGSDVVRFDLNGFTRVYNEALRYVLDGR